MLKTFQFFWGGYEVIEMDMKSECEFEMDKTSLVKDCTSTLHTLNYFYVYDCFGNFATITV